MFDVKKVHFDKDEISFGLTFLKRGIDKNDLSGVSGIKRWAASLSGGGVAAAAARAKLHAAAAGKGLRQGGESLLVGGLLGAASVALPTGLDAKKVPIDAVVAAVGICGGAMMAHEEYGVDLANAGAASAAVFAYRKTQDFMAAKARAAGKKPGFEVHGDDEGFVPHGEDFGAEDPVVAAARFL